MTPNKPGCWVLKEVVKSSKRKAQSGTHGSPESICCLFIRLEVRPSSGRGIAHIFRVCAIEFLPRFTSLHPTQDTMTLIHHSRCMTRGSSRYSSVRTEHRPSRPVRNYVLLCDCSVVKVTGRLSWSTQEYRFIARRALGTR